MTKRKKNQVLEMNFLYGVADLRLNTSDKEHHHLRGAQSRVTAPFYHNHQLSGPGLTSMPSEHVILDIFLIRPTV